MTTRTQSMLVLLAQQGDREALNELLERVQAPLFRYIRGILCSDAAAAEDVLQETLLRIARKLRWLSDPRLFDAWAYRIASNEAYRALKRRRRQPVEEPVDEELPAGDPPPLSAADVSSIVDALSPASRAVLLLHYQEERRLEEIAAILSIPLGTVKSRLAYGLRCLRERMRHEP